VAVPRQLAALDAEVILGAADQQHTNREEAGHGEILHNGEE
ncbi:MAG: hypothetical protein ACI8S6_003959, partial [Myxococcota bacterium]